MNNQIREITFMSEARDSGYHNKEKYEASLIRMTLCGYVVHEDESIITLAQGITKTQWINPFNIPTRSIIEEKNLCIKENRIAPNIEFDEQTLQNARKAQNKYLNVGQVYNIECPICKTRDFAGPKVIKATCHKCETVYTVKDNLIDEN